MLSDNQINFLPKEIANLNNLCVLDMGNNSLQHLPNSLVRLSSLEAQYCGIYLDRNPLISPPPEVITQGTPAILDYLENQAWWHLQRLLISIASGIGLLATLILGLRYRQRRNGKPKQKRSN